MARFVVLIRAILWREKVRCTFINVESGPPAFSAILDLTASKVLAMLNAACPKSHHNMAANSCLQGSLTEDRHV